MIDIIPKLKDTFGDLILFDEEMKKHTSFKTGGKADFFLVPESVDDIIKAVNVCKEYNIPYYILGNCTNVLVTDKGIRGMVIQISSGMNEIIIEDENTIYVQAGALLSTIATKALDNSLSGFEFAAGIPGSFGGAVCMNAGAYDGEIKDVLLSVDVLTSDGKVLRLDSSEIELGYRTSAISKNKYIVLGGYTKLNIHCKGCIRKKMQGFSSRRRDKQPLNYPSAGSTFKRPDGFFAGKLISDSGLKGYAIGGAQVSAKHAGFIVNSNKATSDDIIELIEHCKKTVFEKYNILLETEVEIIGEM